MKNKIKSSEITSEKDYKNRREFMKKGLILGMGSIGGGLSIAKADPTLKKSDLTSYEDITHYNNFYEFSTNKEDVAKLSKSFDTKDWRIEVTGECENPGMIGLEDLIKLFPPEERIYRFRCVEGWSMVIPWEGFELNKLIKKAKPTSKAMYVAFETLEDKKQFPNQGGVYNRTGIDWPYREGLRIDEAMHPLTILATGLYGKPMPNQNGAPIRLVVPWKYGFKSIKSIVKIHLLQHQPKTTWHMLNAQEYGFYSNVNPHVDHPRWSQAKERIIGSYFKRKTEMFNGYEEEVGPLYKGMDLKKYF